MIFDGKPSVVGHRGFGAGRPGGYLENTMPSFLAAARHGLAWIELDAQRSRDGQLVVRHDPVTADGDFVVTRSADVLCVHTGTLGMHRDQPRVVDRSIEQVIGMAHRAGLEILGWPPGPADAVRLAPAGADAICVDDVPGVLSALAGR